MSSTNIRRLFSLTLIVSKIVPWKKELFPCKASSFLLTTFPKEYQACENSRKIQRHSQNIWNHAQLTSFCSHCSRTGCRTVTKFPVLHQKGSISVYTDDIASGTRNYQTTGSKVGNKWHHVLLVLFVGLKVVLRFLFFFFQYSESCLKLCWNELKQLKTELAKYSKIFGHEFLLLFQPTIYSSLGV